MALTSAQEEALLRAFRDIDEGHITLWAEPSWCDDRTGRLRETPIIETRADRPRPAGVPDGPGGWWWMPLIERGWIALPRLQRGRGRWVLTDAGREALVSNRAPEEG
jgi:hypothetical protein